MPELAPKRLRSPDNSTKRKLSNGSSRGNSPRKTEFWSPLGPPTSGCISLLLADKWMESIDPKGMYMSEKLDGCRCYWNG